MKFEKPSLGTIFFIIGLMSLWFISSKSLIVSKPLITISGILMIFPITFITLFAIPRIRKSIKEHYRNQRNIINREIDQLRKEQNKIDKVDKLIELDDKISDIRRELLNFKDNRFERSFFWSIILFIITILIFSLDLGIYIDVSTQILGTAFFFFATYKIADMIETLFICFRD